MARKQKRKPASRPRPRAGAAGPLGPGAPSPSASTAAAGPSSRTGGAESLVRSVEMSLAPRAAGGGRRVQRAMVLDGDPAIPLDRVPFFTADLARLGIVAAVMLVLLLAGAQLIPVLLR